MPRASLFIIIRRLFCSLLLASLAFAQDAATRAIRGIVLDPTGSRIAQASILIGCNFFHSPYLTSSQILVITIRSFRSGLGVCLFGGNSTARG